jgi:hypothetical protein
MVRLFKTNPDLWRMLLRTGQPLWTNPGGVRDEYYSIGGLPLDVRAAVTEMLTEGEVQTSKPIADFILTYKVSGLVGAKPASGPQLPSDDSRDSQCQ